MEFQKLPQNQIHPHVLGIILDIWGEKVPVKLRQGLFLTRALFRDWKD